MPAALKRQSLVLFYFHHLSEKKLLPKKYKKARKEKEEESWKKEPFSSASTPWLILRIGTKRGFFLLSPFYAKRFAWRKLPAISQAPLLIHTHPHF